MRRALLPSLRILMCSSASRSSVTGAHAHSVAHHTRRAPPTTPDARPTLSRAARSLTLARHALPRRYEGIRAADMGRLLSSLKVDLIEEGGPVEERHSYVLFESWVAHPLRSLTEDICTGQT